MSKRFSSRAEINEFLEIPRLGILMYQGARPSPTGVPVWFDWDDETLRLFAGEGSPKIEKLKTNPNASLLATNRVGEPEGWVAFDGRISISKFEADEWRELIDRVAPRYWDLDNDAYAAEIASWRDSPESFVSLTMKPDRIRSGA